MYSSGKYATASNDFSIIAKVLLSFYPTIVSNMYGIAISRDFLHILLGHFYSFRSGHP